MVRLGKITTISVRIEGELAKRLDTLTNIIPVNKSDFLRSCLEKLCDDNQILIDHYYKIGEYISFIINELSKLPEDILVINNGSWTDIKESTILMLCDELWRTSQSVFNNWRKLLAEYDLTTMKEITSFSQAQESMGLLGLDGIIMLMAEKSGQIEHFDIPLVINTEDWIDSVEVDRISLSYACKKAFEEQSALAIIKEYLEKERMEKKEGPQRLVIDAKGSLRRSGSILHLPIDTEEIQKR